LSLPSRPKYLFTARRVILEGFLVAAAGAVLAFSANWLVCQLTRTSKKPLGLALTQDYFAASAITNKVSVTGHPNSEDLQRRIEARLRAEGLRMADSNSVAQLFRDPLCLQEAIVFIDARNAEAYERGHIPGAYLFNHYHPETYIPVIVPACQNAQQIVVYCDGGECDESILAAIQLRDLPGIGAGKLQVYAGGLKEWTANGMPVELGERKSGRMRVEATEGSKSPKR
jgi:rhodanese-related sulfurtransferase